MKPQTKNPFKLNERQILIKDRIWYLPAISIGILPFPVGKVKRYFHPTSR